MFNLFKSLFGSAPAVDYAALIANGAIIIDVRTPGEFKSGHIKGSINIPLDSIPQQAKTLAKKGVPVITCCRSGARSGSAAQILQNAGIEAVNGGPWDSLEAQLG
ncbi:MAG: rhodanese-like domain-containing protein [Saprospiraceae bacterium]|nr:rhodanese-like domain-containing protein [Saprospiraceae bacterium]